jgi:hypothetical protein
MKRSVLIQEYGEWLVGALCAVSIFGGLEIAEGILHFEMTILKYLVFEIPIGLIVIVWLKRFESSHKDLAQITQAMSDRNSSGSLLEQQ